MEGIGAFIERAVVLMVLLNVVTNLVKKEQYERYVRFVTGLLMTLFLVSPILSFFGNEKTRENIAAIFDQDLAESLEEGEAFTNNEELLTYYQSGAEHQVLSFLTGRGYEVQGVQITLGVEEKEYKILRFCVLVKEEAKEIEELIEETYGIKPEIIIVGG